MSDKETRRSVELEEVVPGPIEESVRRPSKMLDSGYSESLRLPSGFKPYETKELYIRPLQVGEVKMLEPALQGVVNYDVADIISKTISMDANELTPGDFWFVCAWLRINSFRNAPLTITPKCPKCNEETVHQIRFTELEIVELPDNFKEPFTVTLPDYGKLRVRLKRVKDEKNVQKYLSQMYGEGKATPDQYQTAMLAATIVAEGGLYERITGIVDTFSGDDYLVLKAAQNELRHGLSTTIPVLGGCDHQYDARVMFHYGNLLPTDNYRRYLRTAISFS